MASYTKKYERVLNALTEGEHLYKTLFEDTDDAFKILESVYDENGEPIDSIYRRINKSAEKLSNLNPEKCLGNRTGELFPSIDPNWFSEWDKVLKSGKPSHVPNYQVRSDCWFDIFSFPYSEGHVGVLYRDITPAIKLQQDKRFRALTIATTELIYQMNPDWSEMTQLNCPGFLKNTLEPERNWISYIPHEEYELVRAAIQKAVENKEIFDLEHRVCRQDESIGWVHSRAVPILNENGDITEWFGAANDITKRKIAEEQLLHRQHELSRIVELKDEFLSIISHEFKTPLNVIFSAVQIMEQRCLNELSNKGKDLLFKIKQNAFRQMRLVNNLLDITRVNAGSMKVKLSNKEVVFYTRALVESVEIYAKQKDITIEFSSSIKRKVIAIDEEFYERIVLNLLSNAIKFTQKGMNIQVVLSLKTHQQAPMICLQVIDQGLGIPDDKTKTIFERFGQVDSRLTRQAEGTGIGLSLVKMLVELMDGTISVDSKLGCGSTFSVLLPDRTVRKKSESTNDVFSNDRLIHSIEVEFSDIYLHI